jgi:CRISPR-associated protein Cas1
MIKKTLYFGNSAYLSLKNSQLLIKIPEVEKNDTLPESFKADAVRTIPIEDIGVVVIDNKQITFTSGLMEALLDNNCAVITCDSRSMPQGLMLSLEKNTTQSERFTAQIEASLPLKKQLWQQTVVAKIENQAAVLKNVGIEKCRNVEIGNMLKWARDVKSGDPDNLEGRAAAYYWKTIFAPPASRHCGLDPQSPEQEGILNQVQNDVKYRNDFGIENFTRSREGVPPNNLLNYGYAILRAVIARSLVASGLLPTLGIHHHNRYNAYCLADDIMEPYRPFVDKLVIEILNVEIKECRNAEMELTKEVKAKLLQIPVLDVVIGGERSPLMLAAGQTTASLAKCYLGENRKITYPNF